VPKLSGGGGVETRLTTATSNDTQMEYGRGNRKLTTFTSPGTPEKGSNETGQKRGDAQQDSAQTDRKKTCDTKGGGKGKSDQLCKTKKRILNPTETAKGQAAKQRVKNDENRRETSATEQKTLMKGKKTSKEWRRKTSRLDKKVRP